jgi:hypothetical protein
LVRQRFGKKWDHPPAYAVPCQFLVDIAGHEDHSQVFPHAERADGKFMAVDVGEFVVAGCKRKLRRRQDKISQQ